jgi:Protein of unknown function (DUF1566)
LGVLVSVFALQAQSACTFFDGFKDNKDGTVTDPRNGLIWKRCAEGFDWNGSACYVSEKKMNWFDAMRTAKLSRFMGKSDWRIPTKSEFQSVVGRYEDCKEYVTGKYAASSAIVNAPEKWVDVGLIWTSSPYEGSSTKVWVGDFLRGEFGGFTRSGSDLFVRLVRASQSSKSTAASEFNSEYAKMPRYAQEMGLFRQNIDEENKQATKTLNAREEAACKNKYVGQRIFMGKALLGVSVYGKVLGVGKKRMSVEIQHPSGSWEVEEFDCIQLD